MKPICDETFSSDNTNVKTNGKITYYPNNIIGKNLFGTVVETHEHKTKTFGTVNIFNKEMVTKILPLCIAGTIMITSLTGCTMGKKDVKETPEIKTEEVYEEPTQRILYNFKLGESLWSVVSTYKEERDIQKELEHICDINNIDDPNHVDPRPDLKLDVPISKLSVFGYTDNPDITFDDNKIVETNTIDDSEIFPKDSEYYYLNEEWAKKEEYIKNVWNVLMERSQKSQYEDSKVKYKTDYDSLFGNNSYMLTVYSEMELIKEMLNASDFYISEDYQKSINKIKECFDEAMRITEADSGISFEDYYQTNLSKTN